MFANLKTCFAKVGAEKLEGPAKNPYLSTTGKFWDELESHCIPGSIGISGKPYLFS